LPGPWYDNGTTLNCTAQDISGKVFDHWALDDVSYDRGYNPLSITADKPHEATAHYLPAPAWWENLSAPQNLPFILALFAVLAGSFVGGAWIRTRRIRNRKIHPETVPVKVPKVAYVPGRIATGCEDLDNLLYGGIPESYSVALTSPSCDERDLLIKRFLETGAEKGEITFYVTIDPGELKSLAEECQSNFYVFVCNPRADTMIESWPNVFKLKGVENLTEIIIALTKAFRALDTPQSAQRRACIEIISDVLLQHHALQTRRWLTDLIPELRSKGFTTLAVVNVQMHPAEEVQAILDLFEGQIAIYEKDTGTGSLRFLRIKKLTNQKYLECELTLRKESLETQNREKNSQAKPQS
jgi:KaiC/GvpD/RAD55 family RecA-like ATPase